MVPSEKPCMQIEPDWVKLSFCLKFHVNADYFNINVHIVKRYIANTIHSYKIVNELQHA